VWGVVWWTSPQATWYLLVPAVPADLSVAGLAQAIDSVLKAALGVAVPKLELTLSLLSLVAVVATGVFVLKLCSKVLKEEMHAFHRLFAGHSARGEPVESGAAGDAPAQEVARLKKELGALKQRHEALLRERAPRHASAEPEAVGGCDTTCRPRAPAEGAGLSLSESSELADPVPIGIGGGEGLDVSPGGGAGAHPAKDRTLIVGVGRMARLAAAEARYYRSENIEVVGFLGECLGSGGKSVAGHPVLGCGDQLRAVMSKHWVDAVLIAGGGPIKGIGCEEDVLALCREMDVECYRFRSGWRHLLGSLPGRTSAGRPVGGRPREKAIILGTGPFAHLAAREALFCLAHRVEVAGFTHKDRSRTGQPFESARILGAHDDLEAAAQSIRDVSLGLIATHEIVEGSPLEQQLRDVCRKASLSLFRFETAWDKLGPGGPPEGPGPLVARGPAATSSTVSPSGRPGASAIRGPGF